MLQFSMFLELMQQQVVPCFVLFRWRISFMPVSNDSIPYMLFWTSSAAWSEVGCPMLDGLPYHATNQN